MTLEVLGPVKGVSSPFFRLLKKVFKQLNKLCIFFFFLWIESVGVSRVKPVELCQKETWSQGCVMKFARKMS